MRLSVFGAIFVIRKETKCALPRSWNEFQHLANFVLVLVIAARSPFFRNEHSDTPSIRKS
jgi:hypothetical protein